MTSNLRAWPAGMLVLAAFSACGRPAPLPPTPTPLAEFAPTATAAPSSTPAPTLTPAATSTLAPTETPPPAPRSVAFPKDTQGRVLGGAFPILNYSPKLVTGKDCPRVTAWGVKTVRFENGLSLGVIDNPCAIQNAVDDFALAAGADPSFLSPEHMRATAPLYAADPLLSKLFPDWWRQRFVDGGAFASFSHYVCDKPVYRLLNVTGTTPTANANPKVQQIHFALVSERFEPFRCAMRRNRDGALDESADRFVRTGQDVAGERAFPVYVMCALWNDSVARWQFQVAAPLRTHYSLDFVRTLYEAGSVKPW